METHQSIVTSPFCGIDRWMDNHYGFSSWNTPGYFERVLGKLTEKGMKYRIYKSLIEHASEGSRNKLEDYNKTEAYMTFIWEPTGQTIQLGGDIDNEEFTNQIPVWSAQWCHRDCGNHLAEGRVDKKRIYVDLEDYDIRMNFDAEKHLYGEQDLGGLQWGDKRVSDRKWYWLLHNAYFMLVSVVLIGYALIMYAVYVWNKISIMGNGDGQKYDEIVNDCTPLIQK